MHRIATILTTIVALLHFGFMLLECWLWTQPFGLKTFNLTEEFAQASATLAFNQGVYNGLFAAGLIFSLLRKQLEMQAFLLGCIVVAGAVGGFTVKPSIYFIQMTPALLALIAMRCAPANK